MSADAGRVSRVVLTFRTRADVRLLTEAGALARRMRAELAGLFVEESDLLRAAALPVTREVGGTSGAVRAIEVAPTQRLLERQTADVRRLVERTARDLEVPWSFTVARGSVVEVAVSAVAGPDVVVLVPAAPSGVARALGDVGEAGAGAGAPQARWTTAPVAAVVDGSPAGERALDAALALAGGRADDLALVVPAGADSGALRRAAARRLGALAPAGQWAAAWPGASLPHVVDLADPRGRPRLRALVVSARHVGSAAELRRLRADVGCPVVLVA